MDQREGTPSSHLHQLQEAVQSIAVRSGSSFLSLTLRGATHIYLVHNFIRDYFILLILAHVMSIK